MLIETQQFGDLLVEIRFDATMAMYRGHVINKPYPVVFSAPSRDGLHLRIRNVVTRYFGKAA
jgi:hypothetical protein